MNIKYFPGLNGIRFLAAGLVIVHHVELIKALFGFKNYYTFPISHIGDFSVTIFFVLSGFLITYLLIQEKYENKEVEIKKFYIRRILRIWPLYFLIVFSSFFIFPFIDALNVPGWSNNHPWENIGPKLFLFVTMMPNVALITYPFVTYAVQCWSIGVEEQFYLIWPHLIKRNNKYLLTLIIFIFTFLSLKFLLIFIVKKFTLYYSIKAFLDMIIAFFYISRFDCMAIGAVGAYLFWNKLKFKIIFQIIYNRVFQILIYGVTLYFLFMKGMSFPFKHLEHEILSLFFLIIILNVSTNKKTIFNLEAGFLNYLGKISFGIYMYHFIGITLGILLCTKIFNIVPEGWLGNIILYISSFAFTIVISHISYFKFEKPFLTFKNSFSVIEIGMVKKENET